MVWRHYQQHEEKFEKKKCQQSEKQEQDDENESNGPGRDGQPVSTLAGRCCGAVCKSNTQIQYTPVSVRQFFLTIAEH